MKEDLLRSFGRNGAPMRLAAPSTIAGSAVSNAALLRLAALSTIGGSAGLNGTLMGLATLSALPGPSALRTPGRRGALLRLAVVQAAAARTAPGVSEFGIVVEN
jgi:hypothetical protein